MNKWQDKEWINWRNEWFYSKLFKWKECGKEELNKMQKDWINEWTNKWMRERVLVKTTKMELYEWGNKWMKSKNKLIKGMAE